MKKLIFIVFILSFIGFSGCSKQPKDIEERVQARWDALFSDDITEAYSYLSPGYRSSVSEQHYRNKLARQAVAWVAASYESKQCEADVCEAKVKLTYRVINPLPGIKNWESTQQVDEKWIRVKGKWYFLPDN